MTILNRQSRSSFGYCDNEYIDVISQSDILMLDCSIGLTTQNLLLVTVTLEFYYP